MGRKGVTAAQVVQAYVSLLKQQRKPGPRNLRLELGTGSYTTISQHLQTLALRHPRAGQVLKQKRRRDQRSAQRSRQAP